jgi:predicted ester cyclase
MNKGVVAMSSEENKALVLALYEQMWNAGNLALIAERVSLERIDHDPGGPAAGEVAGQQELIDSVQGYRTAIPDLHLEFGPQVADDELVATRWTARGTNSGPGDETPPTGKAVEVTGMFIERLAGGKIVESWVEYDRLGMLRQLGLIAVEPAAARWPG